MEKSRVDKESRVKKRSRKKGGKNGMEHRQEGIKGGI